MSAGPWDVEAVLTDLDGVLADSIEAVETAWRRWADEVGLAHATVLDGLHGVRAVETMRRLAPDRDPDAETARLVDYELGLVGSVRSVPGAAALVAALPTERWAVVTSGSRALATARLEALGHPTPAVLVAAEDVATGKPDPEGYLAAAAALGVPAERCLVVEDAPAGVAAGRAAGCVVVAVATSHPAEELRGAHRVVADPGHIAVELTQHGLHITAR